ncbi:choline transporter-like protein 2 [Elysia marginata]|uniref:Choline transporter-like protein n=1 Tax=Elysia marginata TaxID=1093978 RepID=A0AAV4K174_9GAST|nr:choline transporter-like protein 2 [Elysia marginata]
MAAKAGVDNHGADFSDIDTVDKRRVIPLTESPLKDEYNPSHKGPRLKRSCTDVVCCLLFIIFIAGLVVVAYFAFLYGDPELLIYPEDSDGNLCGLGSYKDKKYLFFFDLVKCGRMGPGVFVNGCPTPQVCVEKCPDDNYVYLQNVADQSKSNLICKYNVDLSKVGDSNGDRGDGDDRSDYNDYDGTVDIDDGDDNHNDDNGTVDIDDGDDYHNDDDGYVINRCLPIASLLDFSKTVVEVNTADGNYNLTEGGNSTVSGGDLNNGLDVYEKFLTAKEYGEKIVADVVASWWMILIGLGVAMVISMIWITLMRWIAGLMVWITLLAFVAVWVFLTAICWYLYYDVKGKDEVLSFYMVWRFTFEKEKLFLAGGIIFGAIFVIVFLILLGLCKRIRIAIALIEQGSRAVGSMWSTLLWPVFPFVLQVGVVALWACVAVFLASVGREQDFEDNNVTFANGSINEGAVKQRSAGLFEEVPCDKSGNDTLSEVCGFIKNGDGDYTIYLQVYNLFMLFWLVNFVSALGQLTLAGAFSSYYWTFNKSKDLPTFPVTGAFYRCFRYHLGSLAFGSLLIAIVQVIRTILEYIDSKLKGSENEVAKFLMKCLKCCFWCLEKILRFITKNAYIMMGVHGKNFCSSAKDAFNLILRNVVRVFVLDKVTDFLMFICKLVVVGLVGVAAYFFFNGDIPYLDDYSPRLNFYLVPIVIVILGAYIIADVFFSVYEMAVDTLFLCFLEDLEINDGSPEKPYFMGKDLMNILGKKQEQPKRDE